MTYPTPPLKRREDQKRDGGGESGGGGSEGARGGAGVLPSPGRAGPDTEGGGEGLGGKSDMMPCNLFLWFSEPGERRQDTNTASHAERSEVRVRRGQRSG